MIDDSTILHLYDEHVAKHPTGVKYAQARQAIRDDVRKLVAAAKRDVDVETDVLLSRVLGKSRADRSRGLKRNLDYLLDAFENSDDGAYIDPLLEQAYRLGDQAGTDKVLKNWTAEDLRNLVVTRYRIAADGTAAAAELDKTAQRIGERLQLAGVDRIGDVDWTSMSLPALVLQ